MPLTLNNFVGFETGGLEEASATVNSPTAQTTTVRSGTYALSLAGAVSAPSYEIAPVGTNGGSGAIQGFGYRTTTVIPTNDTDVFQAWSANDATTLIRLRLKAVTGNVDLIDANNAVVGTITAPFSANTWYFIELFWEILAAGDAEVFIDGVSKLSVLNKDFLNVLQNPRVALFTGDNVVGQDTFIDDYYILTGAVVTDRYSSGASSPWFSVPRTYQCTDEDATDLGNTLDVGTWANASEVPVNETNVATYSTAGPMTGGTTTDSPSTRLGPTGGPTLGTIKGAKWIHQLKRGGGAGTTHSKRYGNSGDGLTDAVVALGTAFANFITLSEAATAVPLATESFQYGMKTDGAQDITAAEIWAMIANVTAAVTDDVTARLVDFQMSISQPILEPTGVVAY